MKLTCESFVTIRSGVDVLTYVLNKLTPESIDTIKSNLNVLGKIEITETHSGEPVNFVSESIQKVLSITPSRSSPMLILTVLIPN